MAQQADTVGPHAADVMEQAVDDEMIVFNPATETYFTLNRTAREVWELADGTRSVSDIASELASRYDLDADRLTEDVAEIVASFEGAGLI